MSPGAYHEPVLVDEVMRHLDPREGGRYMDATVGGGGHALRILEQCGECRLLAVDRDPNALDEARRVLAPYRERVRFLHLRFDRAPLDPEVQGQGLDGILVDLGVSSWQIDEDRRGFTFRAGAPLDMRMNPEGDAPTAADLLNEADTKELERIFREWGEERRARALARAVAERRAERPFRTSDDLVSVLERLIGRDPSPRFRARIFQALRIAVNEEMEALETALPAFRDVLVGGGVLVIVAYHSLEDRRVKNAFREWSRACVCPPRIPVCTCRGRPLGETLTSSPVRPPEEEVERNPRARSARLRAWKKAA